MIDLLASGVAMHLLAAPQHSRQAAGYTHRCGAVLRLAQQLITGGFDCTIRFWPADVEHLDGLVSPSEWCVTGPWTNARISRS